MATRFELGMKLSYVPNWTVVDAVREIFQNSLDEAIVNFENDWYFNYDEGTETLRVGNKYSRLETSTLLLGATTKANNPNTIGEHGEGYKVATIVLLRNECDLKIYNYTGKEIWIAKKIKSRRYNTEIAVFDVEKMGILSKVPENSLIFEITGITKKIYEEIKESNLWVQKEIGDVVESEGKGRVLLEDKFKGKIYVKGLYVCDKPNLTYGYDLEPNIIKLDRDRGLVDSWDLQYNLGELILNTGDTNFIYEMKDTWDGQYIKSFTFLSQSMGIQSQIQEVYERTYADFRAKYGDSAVPVSSIDDFNHLKRKGINCALVEGNDYSFITSSSSYSESGLSEEDIGLKEELVEWWNEVKEFLPKELADRGEALIDEVSDYL